MVACWEWQRDKDGALTKFPVSRTGMNTVRQERANCISDCSDVIQDHGALHPSPMVTDI